MNSETIGILTPIVLALLAGVGWIIKWAVTRNSASKEGELSLSQAWALANNSLAEEVKRLKGEVGELRDGFEHLTTSDEQKGREIRELQADLLIVIYEVVPLVQWIDAGAPPPVPTISSRLRRVLSDRRSRGDTGVPGT